MLLKQEKIQLFFTLNNRLNAWPLEVGVLMVEDPPKSCKNANCSIFLNQTKHGQRPSCFRCLYAVKYAVKRPKKEGDLSGL